MAGMDQCAWRQRLSPRSFVQNPASPRPRCRCHGRHRTLIDSFGRNMRGRILQLTIALFAIVVLLPLMLILAIASAVVFRAFPLFTQPRVGLRGRLFTMLTIRTLPADTATTVTKYELTPSTPGRFGCVLRRTHLDELPQLFLVVTGRMALVGPRPEMPPMANAFSETFAQTRETVRPGCTGLWQL